MPTRFRPLRALPALLVLATVAAPAAAHQEGPSPEETNTRIVRQFTEEVYNQQQLDKIPDYVAADFVDRSPGAPQGAVGPEFVRKQAEQSFAGMPDLTFELLRTVAEGDLVAIHWKAVGTGSDQLAGGAAEGKRIETQGISIFRMEDGKIAESWDLVDRLSLLQQAGYRIVPGGTTTPDEVPEEEPEEEREEGRDGEQAPDAAEPEPPAAGGEGTTASGGR